MYGTHVTTPVTHHNHPREILVPPTSALMYYSVLPSTLRPASELCLPPGRAMPPLQIWLVLCNHSGFAPHAATIHQRRLGVNVPT